MTTTPLEWLNEFNLYISDTGTNSGDDQYSPEITRLANGNVVIIWTSNVEPTSGPGSSPSRDILGQVFDPTGQTVGSVFQLNNHVTNGSEFVSSIAALPNGGFTVAYTSITSSLFSTNNDIFMEVYNASGTHLRSIDIDDSPSDDLGYPVVTAVSNTRAMVVWEDQSAGDVLAKIVNPSTGGTVVNTFVAADHATGAGQGIEDYDLIATENGRFALTYINNEPGNNDDEIIFRVFRTNGSQFNTVTAVAAPLDEASQISTALMANGQIVIAWTGDSSGGSNTGIRLSVVNELGTNQIGPAGFLIPHTATAGNQTHPEVVGLKDGGFAIAWYDEPSGDIFSQRYDDSFAKVGIEFRIEGRAPSVSIADIEMTELEDGRFQVVWSALSNGDTDLFTAIWDPRDEPNANDEVVFGTPDNDVLGDSVNPIGPNADEFYMAGGNDTLWINPLQTGVNAVFDGGSGTDTLGLLGPNQGIFPYFLELSEINDFEILKFNAGGAAGLKTAYLSGDQADDFTTYDFAQGGATKQDRLIVELSLNTSLDLSGINIVDFEASFDEIRINGNISSETIVGTEVGDRIHGGGGIDSLDGGLGFDTLVTSYNIGQNVTTDLQGGTTAYSATSGNQTITTINFENFDGGSENNTVYGTDAHANEIRSGGGADIIIGGLQADRLYGEGGNDKFLVFVAEGDLDGGLETIDGGSGTDTVSIGGGTGTVDDNLRNEDFVSIENIEFGHGQSAMAVDRTIQTTAHQFNTGDFSLSGTISVQPASGSQTLEINMSSQSGLDLSDLTFSNFSNGTVHVIGDGTAETITLTDSIDGNDQIETNGGDDIVTFGKTQAPSLFTVDGGSGIDTIQLVEDVTQSHIFDLDDKEIINLDDNAQVGEVTNVENANGGLGDDVFVGDKEDNVFEGGGGGDTLQGGDGLDTASYARSNASVDINLSNNSISGGHANGDTFASIEGLIGSQFGDTLKGDGGVNILRGLDGDDILDGRKGNDTTIGGLGDDTHFVSDTGDIVIEHAGEGNGDRVAARDNYTLSSSAEIELFTTTSTSGTSTISLTGNAFSQTIVGNDGKNVLRSGTGHADILIGLDGDDTYRVFNTGDEIEELANEGDDRVITVVDYTLGQGDSIELFTTDASAGTDNINLTGNTLAQEIRGNAGDNTLSDGGAGGADELRGYGGDDIYIVNNSDTTIVESAGGGTDDRVATSVNFTLAANDDIELFTTTSSGATRTLSLTGNALAQTIIGNAGVNVLRSGTGEGDILKGLDGDDDYRVSNLDDVIVEHAGGGDDRVITTGDYTLTAGAEIERFITDSTSGTDDLEMIGNELDQSIRGNAGDNVIDGKEGNDTLRGLGGDDIYAFTTALGISNMDTIIGYNVADDTIAIDDAIFTGLAGGVGTLVAGNFRANTTGTAQDASDKILYDTNSGELYYDADGNGAGAKVQFAELDAGLSITNLDFDII